MSYIWIIGFLIPLALTVWCWLPVVRYKGSSAEDCGISKIFVSMAALIATVAVWFVSLFTTVTALLLIGN